MFENMHVTGKNADAEVGVLSVFKGNTQEAIASQYTTLRPTHSQTLNGSHKVIRNYTLLSPSFNFRIASSTPCDQPARVLLTSPKVSSGVHLHHQASKLLGGKHMDLMRGRTDTLFVALRSRPFLLCHDPLVDRARKLRREVLVVPFGPLRSG